MEERSLPWDLKILLGLHLLIFLWVPKGLTAAFAHGIEFGTMATLYFTVIFLLAWGIYKKLSWTLQVGQVLSSFNIIACIFCLPLWRSVRKILMVQVVQQS